MNSIGGNSNSGEGGEDPARYGTNKVSRIKQVAQLPGDKVTPYIAKLPLSRPAVQGYQLL
ncbi:hypothetical protein ACN56_14995 [Escherichia coli]|nr:hypothetical protein ACN56_14995 [Escherichia coli]